MKKTEMRRSLQIGSMGYNNFELALGSLAYNGIVECWWICCI